MDFHGDINHKVWEAHSRNLSLSVRQNIISRFQDTHIAPSKEYSRQLMSLDNEQFVSGNRDGVGCSTAVLQKISSQARLQLEEDKGLITSLLAFQRIFMTSMPSINITRPDSPVCQSVDLYNISMHIHLGLFASMKWLCACIAPKSPIFCDATNRYYHSNTKRTRETSSHVLLCFIVLKHSFSVPVAE